MCPPFWIIAIRERIEKISAFFSQTSIQAIHSLQWNIVKYLADDLIEYK